MEEAARHSINYARQLSASGCYSKSFDVYITAFHKYPHMKALFEPEFRIVLMRLNEVLATAGKIEIIFNNFSHATNAFPDNIYLLNEIGKYLYKFAFYTEAWCHFQKALKLDSGYVNAEKNLNSVKNLLVERWHYRMLNDKVRNDAYHEAIHKTVISLRDSVLDIGTGTGILSIYASECSPLTTIACDSSLPMSKLAESVVQENQIQELKIINKMSTDMNYKEICGKKSVLITELFDAGLFGEHILQTLSHAWDNLLSSDGKVIPNKAEYFVIGADCKHLNRKYQLGRFGKELLNITSLSVHILTYGESYDCEDVHLINDIKYLTEPQSLVKIDFSNIFDIQEKLHRQEPYNVEFVIKDDGEINTVVGWFHLHLTDEITLTTDPRSDIRANAWQQAVFFDNIPVSVKENDTLELNFLMNNGKLSMLPTSDKNILRASPETIRFLNDIEYLKIIKGCIPMASVYLGQMAEMSQINMIDLCPFPVFGLLMLKRGIRSLVCNPKTDSDKEFCQEVFKANDIPLSKITFLVGDDWTQEVFNDEKFHAVFCNIFELCGDIDMRKKDIAQNLKHAHLLQGGLFMPSNIKLIAQLINSHWLDINNRLYDENVHNYKIAQFINMYQVSQNFCVDLKYLDYIPITDPYIVGNCTNNNMRGEVLNVPIASNGHVNAILCWYNIEILDQMGEMSTNRSDCFIDGMAFLANPKIPVFYGDTANILRCVDTDGSFKLMIDTDSNR